MMMGKLPATGKIELRSDIGDWEPLILGYESEFHSKAIITVQKNEKKEIDVLITEIYPPNSILTETFISVTCVDSEVTEGLQGNLELLKDFLGESMWMLKGFVLDNEKKIPIFMVFFPIIQKTFYVIMKNESHFFSNHMN